jgi:HAD superfamily hydrolase (TIGR01490 family)
MSLALFDLDNTLLSNDSDYLWGQFLVEQGLVDGEFYERENQRFYDAYRAGTLNIYAFLAFMLKPLTEYPLPELLAWRSHFMREKIEPIILPKAVALLEQHRAAGDTLVIITATNRFITEPIASRLGISNLLATEIELIDGRYTGRALGTPCFHHGKVERLQQWLAETGYELTDSWFYTDSRNDLPLLNLVAHPVAVDPDQTLAEHATAHGWPMISLRD